MPICNEDVQRVFAGLRATYESVARTDALDHFDFFVLSDTATRTPASRSLIPGMRYATSSTPSRACFTGPPHGA